MANEAVIEQIKAAVETIAARNQDEWAFANGHRDQKWATLKSEDIKQSWRERVTVAELYLELKDPE